MSVKRPRHCWLPRLCVLLALTSVVVSAQDTGSTSSVLYDVELVIFRPLSPSTSAEEWVTVAAAPAGNPTEDDGTSLDASMDQPPDDATWPQQVPPALEPQPALVAVEPTQQRLESTYATLRRSAGYRPLAHLGWLQEAAALGQGEPVDLSPLIEPGVPLHASATLERGRYLHLTLVLELESPDDGRPYTIRQTRRMRSGERHYFDHPFFGAIALITPHRDEQALGQHSQP